MQQRTDDKVASDPVQVETVQPRPLTAHEINGVAGGPNIMGDG